MALRSIFGILKRTILGVFRQPRTFMPEIMCALCTMNLNVSLNAEREILLINHHIWHNIIEVNQYLRA